MEQERVISKLLSSSTKVKKKVPRKSIRFEKQEDTVNIREYTNNTRELNFKAFKSAE